MGDVEEPTRTGGRSVLESLTVLGTTEAARCITHVSDLASREAPAPKEQVALTTTVNGPRSRGRVDMWLNFLGPVTMGTSRSSPGPATVGVLPSCPVQAGTRTDGCRWGQRLCELKKGLLFGLRDLGEMNRRFSRASVSDQSKKTSAACRPCVSLKRKGSSLVKSVIRVNSIKSLRSPMILAPTRSLTPTTST